MRQRLAKLTLTTACGLFAVLTMALEAAGKSDLAPIRDSTHPSGQTRSHAVAGGFRRCCFRVQVEARGELSNAYNFDDGVGTHVISWRWSARELVQYEEQGGRPQLSRVLVRPTLDGFAPGEVNLLYEERRNISDPTPESGQVGGPGEDLFDPCSYRFSTGGYRSDRGRTGSSFVRLQRYTAHPRLKASRYLVAEVATTSIFDEPAANRCDALGEHTIFDLPIPLQGTWHGLQGPLTYALPPPPLTHFRQKRRIVVADRQAFAVPAAHAPPGARHTSQASTQITVTFTYVPEARSGGATAAGRCANPKTGTPRADRLIGTQRGDLLLGLGGNDVLLGLGGDDCLIGGPGRDTVDAGPGNDVVSAKDGIAETVRCGPGTDTVVADRSDRLVACERVSTG